MGTIGIVGLFLGILTLIIVSYKGFHAVPTSLLAGLVIMTFNCINIFVPPRILMHSSSFAPELSATLNLVSV